MASLEDPVGRHTWKVKGTVYTWIYKLKDEQLWENKTSYSWQSCDIKGALFKGLYLLNYVSDRVETLHVSTKGSVIDENWHDVLIRSSHDPSRDIKGALFKPLYLLNYMCDRIETLHVYTEGIVLDKN